MTLSIHLFVLRRVTFVAATPNLAAERGLHETLVAERRRRPDSLPQFPLAPCTVYTAGTLPSHVDEVMVKPFLSEATLFPAASRHRMLALPSLLKWPTSATDQV